MSAYFDRQGKPIELMDWVKKVEDLDYRIVKQEQVGEYFVNTIWLGVNMNIFRKEPKQIFETMIFKNEPDENDDLDRFQKRYETEKQALEGHKTAVCMVEMVNSMKEEQLKNE